MTGVQTCALPICTPLALRRGALRPLPHDHDRVLEGTRGGDGVQLGPAPSPASPRTERGPAGRARFISIVRGEGPASAGPPLVFYGAMSGSGPGRVPLSRLDVQGEGVSMGDPQAQEEELSAEELEDVSGGRNGIITIDH